MTRSGQAEAGEVDTSALAAARSKVGRPARATVDGVATLVQRSDALVTAGDRLRERARRQAKSCKAGNVRAQLRRKPIGDLKEFAGRGARLGQLEKAGFRTVGDVLKARPHDLERVPGVGPRTAHQVTAAAKRVEAELADTTVVRLDPDRRNRAQTELLATLAAIRAADAVPDRLREDLAAFSANATPLVAGAKRTTGWFRMVLSSRARRQAALLALIRLEDLQAERRTRDLERAMARHEPLIDPATYDPGELWGGYLADAATVNTTIANLREQDAVVAGGFIPEELRQRITALPLDTTLVRAKLRRYQVFGAQYAIHQERSMLGDEMGLGKTVQALAALAHLAAHGQRRFLVVCPASVQVNWLKEIGRHTELTAHSLHGADRDQTARAWLRDGGVAVTTFGTLHRLQRRVRTAEVAMLVVDEAHYVKNPKAERTRVVAEVVRPAQRVLFLTGTPMENRVREFRALVQHLQPWVADRVDPTGEPGGARAFRRVVAPVYLRRNQEDVLDELPDKIEVEDWVQLSARDEAEYLAAVASRNLMAMRQAAFASTRSAKLERLVEIVDEAAQDRMKVVVFSFFLDVLDTVARTLGRAVVGSITGAVDPATRQRLVDEFSRREGHAVLLAQIEAGGVGLNVQAASVVIITEPQWKPGTEDQAVARAHRMGQVRKVQVHRLLAKDGVDERIREIQEGKRLLFDEYARKSDAKDADVHAIDPGEYRPGTLDDGSVPAARRVVMAEEHRLAARLRRR